jgi:hypothetical protein
VVHPFHPLAGKEFELVGFGHTRGDQKVYYRKPDQQRVYSMPTSWTDLGPVDAYVELSSGRAFGRPEDLLAVPFNKCDPQFKQPDGSTREARHPADHDAAPVQPPRRLPSPHEA